MQCARNSASNDQNSDARASSNLNIPSDMPTEHAALIHQKYAEHLHQNKLKKKKQREASKSETNQKQEYPRPPDGISPLKLGLKRISAQSAVQLTQQVLLEAYSI